jgi:hypothetical protein
MFRWIFRNGRICFEAPRAGFFFRSWQSRSWKKNYLLLWNPKLYCVAPFSLYRRWRRRQYAPPKRRYLPTSPHGVITQKTNSCMDFIVFYFLYLLLLNDFKFPCHSWSMATFWLVFCFHGSATRRMLWTEIMKKVSAGSQIACVTQFKWRCEQQLNYWLCSCVTSLKSLSLAWSGCCTWSVPGRPEIVCHYEIPVIGATSALQ